MPTAKEILARGEELRNERATWDNQFQEISDYGIGRRDFSAQTRTQGRKRTHLIFDTTFMHGAELLSAGLHSLLSNPATRFFSLRFEREALNEIDEAALWLQASEHQLYFAIGRPNAHFSGALHEAYSDIVAFGTGAVFIEDTGPEGAAFVAVPLSTIYLANDPLGRIDTVMWYQRLTAKQIVQQYGKDAPKRAKQAVEKGMYEERYEVLRAVMRRDDPQLDSIGPRGMPWASYHVSVEDAEMLREGGYHEMPFAVGRWDRDSGETYGRGPGIRALASHRVANEQQKTLLKAAQKRVDPALLVPKEGVVTALQMQPGGVTVYEPAFLQGGKPPIFPIDTGSDIPIGVETLEMTRQDVRSAFHFELLELIQHVPGTTPITATHVAEIAANQQRVIAPILGRIQEDLLSLIIGRVYGIEARAGRLPPAPSVLARQPIRIEYVSPAMRAQRQQDARAVRNVMATAAEYGKVDSVATRMVKADEAIRVIADAEGSPREILRSRAELERILAAERELAMREQQTREAAAQAEIASRSASAARDLGATP